jgi:hypothetical protein
MARLLSSGFEVQIASTTSNYNGETELGGSVVASVVTGSPTFDTTNHRSGAAALSCAAASTYHQWSPVFVLDRTYYLRAYIRVNALPVTNANIVLNAVAASVAVVQVQLNTDSTLSLLDAAGNVGSPSAALSAATWYRIELEFMIPTAGAGIVGLYLDGTQIARSITADTNNSVAANTQIRVGWTTPGAPGQTILVDDVALNDNQGADQNTFPGSGKIVLLKPTSHSAIGNWVGPQTTGDDTTSLNLNVDNTPPLGVAFADTDANAERFAFNVTNAATQNFDLNVTDYTTAGITGTDTVMLCQALGRMSVNTTTGTNTGAVAGVSNPACTATTANNLELTGVAGTEPTGWKSIRTAPTYAPSVTLGTSPVVRVQKEVANANAAMVDLMGLLVEYQPLPPAPPPVKSLSALGVG